MEEIGPDNCLELAGSEINLKWSRGVIGALLSILMTNTTEPEKIIKWVRGRNPTTVMYERNYFVLCPLMTD